MFVKCLCELVNLDEHATEEQHESGQDDSTLFEAVGHGQDTHSWTDRLHKVYTPNPPMMELARVMVEVRVMVLP